MNPTMKTAARLRRLADAIEAEERAAYALWQASRKGEPPYELREQYRTAQATTRFLREEVRGLL